jgi:PPE-repeat protein
MSVVDFAALPPEINSGRMYAGAGPGPLLAAAAAWDGLASELSAAATSYRSTVSELTGAAWLGPSSASMAAAVAPYVAWMTTTAAQAEQTASQLASAVAAYEAAFTATVPPPVIAANRALLASLVATNIVGQNTPAIAATEAQYAEMWAQDAAAMYGYAGASAAATTLTPFSAPTQTTNPAGTGNQAAARASAAGTSTGTAQNALSQVPTTLQSLASGGSSQAMLTVLNSPVVTDFETLSTALGVYTQGYTGAVLTADGSIFVGIPMITTAMSKGLAAAAAAPAAAVSAAPDGALGTLVGSSGSGAGSAGPGGAGASAGLDRAATVGALSVPPSWGTASPAIRLVSTALPTGGLDGLPGAGAAGPAGSFGGPVASVINAPRNGAAGPPSESRLKVIPQVAGEPGAHQATPGRWVNAPDRDTTVSERDELNGLRTAIAELAKERDVLMRSAALVIKEAMAR